MQAVPWENNVWKHTEANSALTAGEKLLWMSLKAGCLMSGGEWK